MRECHRRTNRWNSFARITSAPASFRFCANGAMALGKVSTRRTVSRPQLLAGECPAKISIGSHVCFGSQTASSTVEPAWQLRVISCRDRPDRWCPLHPRKVPQHSLNAVSALGHKRTVLSDEIVAAPDASSGLSERLARSVFRDHLNQLKR
jgi:hypothetical protein